MHSEWVILAYGILGGLAFVLLPRLLLCVVGFTCCGVRKKSYASDWHSLLGEVESGSSFSCFQRTGAGGTPCGTKIGMFLFGCYLTIMLFVIYDFSNVTPEPSKDLNYNYTTVSFTVAPTNFTDFFTLESTDTDNSFSNVTQSPSSSAISQ